MAKSTYGVLLVIGIVIFSIGLLLSAAGGYAVWRSFESIGIYTFTSTGELLVKEERVKTGRRTSKAVNRDYAVFTAENGKYRYEEKISPSQKMGIRRNSQYSLQREVFMDRQGEVKVTRPESQEEHDRRGWSNVASFAFIAALGAALTLFSYRKRKLSF